jgi:hypothetical protein
VSEIQPVKHSVPRISIEAGKQIEFREVHREMAADSMQTSLDHSSNVNTASEVQQLK